MDDLDEDCKEFENLIFDTIKNFIGEKYSKIYTGIIFPSICVSIIKLLAASGLDKEGIKEAFSTEVDIFYEET